MPRRRRHKKIDRTPFEANIISLQQDGRGLAHDVDGNRVYVDYALPNETVECVADFRREGQIYATATNIVRASSDRVEAKCPVFGECGGCILQHLDAEKQIAFKQAHLQQNLTELGGVTPENWLPPLSLSKWNYRRRARLGIKYVPKKGGVIVGFRERKSAYIQPTDECHVLLAAVSDLIPKLRELVTQLSCFDKIPQLEVSVSDNATALVLRHLAPFNSADLQLLTDFAKANAVQLFLQPGKLKSVHPHYPTTPEPLYYTLNAFDIRIEFLPTDFVQVNKQINQKMVALAIDLLEVSSQDSVLDLFSGVGNFTLPLARRAARVVGVEGDQALVARANHNRTINQLENVEFYYGDLYSEAISAQSHGDWLQQSFDKILLDPPRSGAEKMIALLPQFGAKRVVYVSCGPSSLARDANILVNQLSYRLLHAGVIDMFPHTAHVESIAVFEKA